MKRPRPEEEPPIQDPSTPPNKRSCSERRLLPLPLPLTKHNLALMASEMSPAAPHTPIKDSNAQPRTPVVGRMGPPSSPSTSISSASTAALDAQFLFHRMFLRRGKPMSADLTALFNHVKIRRESQPTPASEKSALVHKMVHLDGEGTAMHTLAPILIDHGILQDNITDEKVFYAINELWLPGAIPRPDKQENSYLQKCCERYGIPKTPKPDIAYGYTGEAFDFSELEAIHGLPGPCLVRIKKPFFPFLCVEWKSDLEPMSRASRQAVRDGAAAVSSMHELLQYSGVREPDPAMTATFGLCVTSEMMMIFIHWRRTDPTNGVSWETDRVGSGILEDVDDIFKIRSVLMQIFEWARTTRLEMIKKALANVTKAQSDEVIANASRDEHTAPIFLEASSTDELSGTTAPTSLAPVSSTSASPRKRRKVNGAQATQEELPQ